MAKYSMLTVMSVFSSQSPSTVPRDQLIIFHHGAEREVPHQEQVVSSLPIKRLHRGQRIARCFIKYPPLWIIRRNTPGFDTYKRLHFHHGHLGMYGTYISRFLNVISLLLLHFRQKYKQRQRKQRQNPHTCFDFTGPPGADFQQYVRNHA